MKIAAEANTTPLGLAALIGSDTMMQYLLDAGSQAGAGFFFVLGAQEIETLTLH